MQDAGDTPRGRVLDPRRHCTAAQVRAVPERFRCAFLVYGRNCCPLAFDDRSAVALAHQEQMPFFLPGAGGRAAHLAQQVRHGLTLPECVHAREAGFPHATRAIHPASSKAATMLIVTREGYRRCKLPPPF
ncbi:hypothetical protein [Streptomyces sp. NPDC001480]|uniref:hypothetical protein n=1 Tax=Streptomyces sp. NPDC001480 TaxID=3364577 RepID=UPI0036970E4D